MTVVLGFDTATADAAVAATRDGDVIRKYGVDFLFGFAKRKTFLIGTDGKIARIFQSVSPAKHAAEVREALASVG